MYTNDTVRGTSNTSNTNQLNGHQRNERDVCQVQVGDKICGETQTLQITREFRQLYEDKLKQIDSVGGGDCVQVRGIRDISKGCGCGLF